VSENLDPGPAPKPPDPTPSSPPPVPEEEKPEQVRSPQGVVTTGAINASSATLIGHLQIAAERSNRVPFSFDSASKVTPEREAMLTALFVGDQKFVDELVRDLERCRILLLSGERSTGKATLALRLGTLIAERKHLTNNTLSIDPLNWKMSFDVSTIVTDAFEKRAIVFSDVFAGHNDDLHNFFARTTAPGWEELANKLRANSAFLIFTAETHHVEKFRQLAGCLACRSVPPLSRELVARGFELKMRWLETNQVASAEHVRIAGEHRDRVIDELQSLQRVVLFLEQYAVRDPDIDAALRVFNDVGGMWFAKELAADVDAWCFALTLALTRSARDVNGVGWYEFDCIRRAITERVKTDVELFPRRRRSESHEFDTDEKGSAQSLFDDLLLARCRAEIGKDSSRLGDAVRFIDDSYAAKIWRHAVTHNRRVLTMLLPTLRGLAEDGDDYGVRALAARMIGRIGELDPFSISIPLVRHEWVEMERQRPFVGRLLQGMRDSGNDKYQQSAIGAVDALTADRPGDPEAENNRLLTAIFAYSLLGEDDFDTAMARLGTIAIEKLAPVMADFSEIGRDIEIVSRSIVRTSSRQRADNLRTYRLRLARLAKQLDERRADAIYAMKQALVYLCVSRGIVLIVRGMRDWISKGGTPTGTLVALLFLHGGIAEELESVAGNARSLSGDGVASPFAQALAEGSDAVQHVASFLADLHASINATYSLPDPLQRELRERLNECLTGWAGDVKHRDAVAELFVSLTNVRNGAMRDDIYALFATTAFSEEQRLRDFATEVRRKCLERAGELP
jgi:hypothetical protein